MRLTLEAKGDGGSLYIATCEQYPQYEGQGGDALEAMADLLGVLDYEGIQSSTEEPEAL